MVVDTLVVRAGKVIVGEEKPAEKPTRRQLINSALFAVLMVLLWILYVRHFQTYVTQVAVFSGITLFALWKIIDSWANITRGAGGLRKRFLAGEKATEYLIVAIAFASLLFVATSSAYIRLESKDIARAEFHVLGGDDRQLMQIVLTPQKKVGGGLLLRRHPFERKLRIEVIEPRDHKAREYSPFRPWTSIDLTFPDKNNFPEKKYLLARIVPGRNVYSELRDAPPDQYFLIVNLPGNSYEVRPYKFQTIYIGAPEATLKRLTPQHHNEQFRSELVRYLNSKGITSAEAMAAMAPYLNEAMMPPRNRKTRELEAGEKVRAELYRRGETSHKLIGWGETAVASNAISNAFVEIKR